MYLLISEKEVVSFLLFLWLSLILYLEPLSLFKAFFIPFRKMGLKGQRAEGQNKFLIALTAALVAIPLTFAGFLGYSADPSVAVERTYQKAATS
jgi:hypothetical protein